MDALCRTEVIELHQFFEAWFSGGMERTAENFARFSDALAKEFEIILPDGHRLDFDTLTRQIEASHGSALQRGRPLRICIENYQGRSLAEGLHLVTYEEWQDDGAERRGRLSTALFRKTHSPSRGIQWIHLHEVWLPR